MSATDDAAVIDEYARHLRASARVVDPQPEWTYPVIRLGVDHYLHVVVGTMRGHGEREPLVEELDRVGCDLEHVTIFDAIEAAWMMLGHA